MYVVLLFVAGIGAGILGYLVGLASLVSYPALVALGVPPVLANTSNTVGLLGSGIGSVASAWRRMAEVTTYPLRWQLAVAAVGGLVGGALLVMGDSAIFEAVVPWLVLAGTLLVAAGPYLKRQSAAHRLRTGAFLAILFLITIYGGYFGAGAGVLFIALCALATPMSTHEAVLMKSPLLLVSNFTASLLFIARGDVDWQAAIVLGIGAFIGGWFGPAIQGFISERALRWLVVLGGLTMVVWLLVR